MPASSQASTSKNKEPFKRTTKNSQRAGVIEEDILGALGRAKKSPADRARQNEQDRTESILQARLDLGDKASKWQTMGFISYWFNSFLIFVQFYLDKCTLVLKITFIIIFNNFILCIT